MKPTKSQISIIIPTLNEALGIGHLLKYLNLHGPADLVKEILVVDGGSEDDTAQIARQNGAKVYFSEKGRATQMNRGAACARGQVLYFLHADTYPPTHFAQKILSAVAGGNEAGCFQMQFDSSSWFLRFFSWFSRFNITVCRGGDQSLFVSQPLFRESQGFDENYRIYEDNEFIGRLYRLTQFKVLPAKVTTSARRYRQKQMLKLQFHFGIMHLKNYMGAGPDALYTYYKKNIAI